MCVCVYGEREKMNESTMWLLHSTKHSNLIIILELKLHEIEILRRKKVDQANIDLAFGVNTWTLESVSPLR